MTAETLSCPVCATELDSEQWCTRCDRHVSDAEIAEHERIWGGELEGNIWYDPS